MGDCGPIVEKMKIYDFISTQLEKWTEAAARHNSLRESVVTRSVDVEGHKVILQHNPARAISTGAKVDAESIASRPCFLCSENRPEPQEAISFGGYDVLVNPYPIFPNHLTIADKSHRPQSIDGRIPDMLRLADSLEGFTIFYNGPKCGASAPDHAHFQAATSECFPIWSDVTESDVDKEFRILHSTVGFIVIESAIPEEIDRRFMTVLSKLRRATGSDADEPKLNLLASKQDGVYRLIVIPRRAHRPAEFGTDDGSFMISPASIDMSGVLVLPRRKDFDRLTAADIRSIFQQTGYSVAELQLFLSPVISVGIMESENIEVVVNGTYMLNDCEIVENMTLRFSTPALLRPLTDDSTFTLRGVTIGIDFHWQQQQDQTFEGELQLILNEGGGLTAINRLPVESYILSVISSEMNSDAPVEFLKAHAVISRSWALAQIVGAGERQECPPVDIEQEEIVRWYDHAAHTRFDVCADDHCQRYQGIARAVTPQVKEAIDATRSLVLTFDGKLCDARFSKCCGGVTERFSTCWQPVDYAYLPAVTDCTPSVSADVSDEKNARHWITSTPDAFCANPGPEVLSMILNTYDRETPHLYRWEVSYSASELEDIVVKRSGLDFGKIVAIEPLHRGPSGRIDRLRIIGTRLTRIIGKELEIRRTLSHSHLYSSAFIVETGQADSNGIPQSWTFKGAGWGHGVGLCQIGAAVMATGGYDYRQILSHYFPGSQLDFIEDYERK